MARSAVPLERQLRRQLSWLGPSWTWLMRVKVLDRMDGAKGKPTALDVGCGPGLVMDLFSPWLDVKGVDIDAEVVRSAKERGMDVMQGDALFLPFQDNSFDIAYCSFVLLWVRDPQQAVREMARVARRWVICLAEPDYGGRICHPPEVAALDRHLEDALKQEGADPFLGRGLGKLLQDVGLEVELGTHSGVWSPERMREEADDEWSSILELVEGRADPLILDQAKGAWNRALRDGSLFLYNPVFYAIGRK